MLPRCEVLRDRKLSQFLHFPTCFPAVKCSVTENWLSFYIFQHASPLWSTPWQKTVWVSTFSKKLPRCEALHDWKPEQFLHFLTCFPVAKYSVTQNCLSFYIFQHASPLWSAPWHKTVWGSTFSKKLPRCEVLHDWKPEQFLHFLTCFPVAKYSVTQNCLSFYIFQHASPLWSAPWQKTGAVSTFSNVLSRC
jgi:hypothetical protein